MTAPHIVNPAQLLGNLLTEASPDMMRQLLQTIINALLSAERGAFDETKRHQIYLSVYV